MAEKFWYYLDAGDEKIAFLQEDLSELVKQGRIKARSLVWVPGNSAWRSCSELFPSYFVPGATIAVDLSEVASVGAVKRVAGFSLPGRREGSTAGTSLIVLGVVLAFTLLGLPVGALLIFAGFQWRHAHDLHARAARTGEEGTLREAEASLGTGMRLVFWAALVGSMILALVLAFALLALFGVVDVPGMIRTPS